MSVTKTFRFPDEVVAQKVDVIVTNGTPGLCRCVAVRAAGQG